MRDGVPRDSVETAQVAEVRRGRLALAPSSDRPSVASSEPRERRQLSEAQRAVLDRHRFKPGQSGNPSGRLKGLQSAAALVDRALLEVDPATGVTRLEQVVYAFVDACARCEMWAVRLLLDRVWPIPRLGVDLNARLELTDADREAFAERIERELAEREAAGRSATPDPTPGDKSEDRERGRVDSPSQSGDFRG